MRLGLGSRLFSACLLFALGGPVLAGDSPIDGPEPPVPPAVATRDDQGRVTLRATRLDTSLEGTSLTIDGRLEESVYQIVPAVSGFIQQEPREGEPATEKTEVWLFFDRSNVYVSARCWDSQPDRMVANEMRRDNRNIFNNENFGVIFDTFYDRRNGFLFYTNPLGALFDGQVTDESSLNSDWNTVWHVETGRWADGWTVEMKIPFKSLRFKGSESEIWGINFRRIVRWKNETSHLTPIAAAYRQGGFFKLSSAATVVGLEPSSKAINLEIKPYATAGVGTDLAAEPPFENDVDGNLGFDLKYGVTKGLTFDFTLNTDFAQVEADEQQVNLTRFGLFFPEKRDFFLEGQGIFAFAGIGGGRGRGSGGPRAAPILFFSRQIGLYDETVVPINAGGRLTGRAGDYTLGLLAIQTDALPQFFIPKTDFGVVRVKRDIFRRSNIGLIGTYRSPAEGVDGSNAVFGVDANFSFFQNLNIKGYYAHSDTTGLVGDDASYLGRIDYGSDLWGFDIERLVVEENFNPEIGFLLRENFERTFGRVRYSPRPESIDAIRKFDFEGSIDYIVSGDGQLETQLGQVELGLDFENGDRLFAEYSHNIEVLDEEFDITDDILIPVGEYSFHRGNIGYRFGPQRRVSGWLSLNHGSFFSGKRTDLFFSGGVELTPQFTVEPRISINWVDLAEGSFTATLFRARINYMLSPRTFVGALLQYNSDSKLIATNIRFRWEYQPGSDLFIVYSDGRDTLGAGRFGILESRALVVKFTRLFRF
jgi:hypothetical protein